MVGRRTTFDAQSVGHACQTNCQSPYLLLSVDISFAYTAHTQLHILISLSIFTIYAVFRHILITNKSKSSSCHAN